MSYQKSIAYLYGLQKFGIKFGLAKISKLLSCLDNPHKKLSFIHIAGTNGKGSTAACLASVLSKAGYRVGLYTSPHLTSFTERIKIGNHEISRKDVDRLTQLLINKARKIDSITFFEFVTAMALLYFAEKKVDLCILEVGMGGRLDATNVVSPIISIITNISKEHEYYLGNTILEIAREKAGIIKKKSSLITGATQANVLTLFRKRCHNLQTEFYCLGEDFSIKTRNNHSSYHGINFNLEAIKIGLFGDFQYNNAAIALAAIELLRMKDYHIGDKAIYRGLKDVYWPGRLEIVKKAPVVILDGAHNPVAMKSLRNALIKNFNFEKLILILGIMEDKNIKGMLKEIVPYAHKVILCKPNMNRAASPTSLAGIIKVYNVKHYKVDDVKEAILYALSTASKKDLICVAGSLFTVGEAREVFKKKSCIN
ncbi:MAG: bifunctional folylpolyglutamate synthase/dihydrofolate synthase [Deltaproteobacteria bacterium]|nr:bifunctional folylpolyglutamate synthase/dihydrofolate synthase [Deltaproteobacteria bacterium]